MNAATFIMMAVVLGTACAGEFQCNIDWTVKADSRFDRTRGLDQNDAYLEDMDFLKLEGISSSSPLRAIMTNNYNQMANYSTDTLQYQGVNAPAALKPYTGDPRYSGDILAGLTMDGSLDLYLAPMTNAPVSSTGTTWTTGSTAGGLTFSRCYFGSNAQLITVPQGEYAALCALTSGGFLIEAATFTLGALECATLYDGVAFTPTGTGNYFFCPGFATKKRSSLRHTLKVKNWEQTHSFDGKDSHLCVESKGCYLWGEGAKRRTAPLTADGVHGSIVVREEMRRLSETVQTQCASSDTFSAISASEALLSSIGMLQEEIDELRRSLTAAPNTTTPTMKTTQVRPVTKPLGSSASTASSSAVIHNGTLTDDQKIAIGVSVGAASLFILGVGGYFLHKKWERAGPR